MRVIIAAVVAAGLVGCGGHAPSKTVRPRSIAEVEHAFAHHGIRLVRVQPSVGARVRYTALFGQSGSLSVSVRVYARVGAVHSEQDALQARNVLVTWQGADRPSVEAAVDELR